ncbi:MAG: hypothetical protein QM703_14510 [Gemmatales bacterium]
MFKVLRWLLVALLPFVGLYVGSLLTPQLKPRWEVMPPFLIVGLGYAEQGKSFLIQEWQPDPGNKDRSKQIAVIGIDPSTGRQQFRYEIPEELRMSKRLGAYPQWLFNEGSVLLFFDDTTRQILLYDWKRQQILRRYQTEPKLINLNQVVVKKNTLTAFMWSPNYQTSVSESYIVVWDIDSPSPKHTVGVGEQATDLRLSDDGTVASINNITNNVDCQVIVDTVQGRVIQKIKGWPRDVKWSADSKKMYVIIMDQQGNTVIQTFLRSMDKYELTSEKIIAPAASAVASDHLSYFAEKIYLRNHQLRRWANKLFGDKFKSFVDRLLPQPFNIAIYDPDTGDELMVQHCSGTEFIFNFFADPHWDGFIVGDKQTLIYWPFTPLPTWPKWLGLIAGILLSTLMAWKSLQVKVRR